MWVLFHPSHRGQPSLLAIRQRRQNKNCLSFSLVEGPTCSHVHVHVQGRGLHATWKGFPCSCGAHSSIKLVQSPATLCWLKTVLLNNGVPHQPHLPGGRGLYILLSHSLFQGPWLIYCFTHLHGTLFLLNDCDVLPVPSQVFTVDRTVGLLTVPETDPSLLWKKYRSVLYRLLYIQQNRQHALASGISDLPALKTETSGETYRTAGWNIRAQV